MFIQKEHDINSNNSKKNHSKKKMTCSKLYVTKIKYSKSLQSQRTKGKPSLTTRHKRIIDLQITDYRYLLFFAICIAVYSPILAPVLI